jgi:hypothetical protein
MIFIGVDWAEAHHDVCVLDAEGKVLGRKRILDSLAGVGELHAASEMCLASEWFFNMPATFRSSTTMTS